MFSGCCNLLSIILPRNITHIGDAAFQNCTYLKSIVISEYVTDIFNVDDFIVMVEVGMTNVILLLMVVGNLKSS